MEEGVVNFADLPMWKVAWIWVVAVSNELCELHPLRAAGYLILSLEAFVVTWCWMSLFPSPRAGAPLRRKRPRRKPDGRGLSSVGGNRRNGHRGSGVDSTCGSVVDTGIGSGFIAAFKRRSNAERWRRGDSAEFCSHSTRGSEQWSEVDKESEIGKWSEGGVTSHVGGGEDKGCGTPSSTGTRSGSEYRFGWSPGQAVVRRSKDAGDVSTSSFMSGKKGDGATETIIGRDSVAPNMEALSMRNTAFAAVLRAVGVRGGASGALKAAARLRSLRVRYGRYLILALLTLSASYLTTCLLFSEGHRAKTSRVWALSNGNEGDMGEKDMEADEGWEPVHGRILQRGVKGTAHSGKDIRKGRHEREDETSKRREREQKKQEQQRRRREKDAKEQAEADRALREQAEREEAVKARDEAELLLRQRAAAQEREDAAAAAAAAAARFERENRRRQEQEAEAAAKREAELKIKLKIKREAEMKATRDAERQAKREAKREAKRDAERKAKAELQAMMQAKAQRDLEAKASAKARQEQEEREVAAAALKAEQERERARARAAQEDSRRRAEQAYMLEQEKIEKQRMENEEVEKRKKQETRKKGGAAVAPSTARLEEGEALQVQQALSNGSTELRLMDNGDLVLTAGGEQAWIARGSKWRRNPIRWLWRRIRRRRPKAQPCRQCALRVTSWGRLEVRENKKLLWSAGVRQSRARRWPGAGAAAKGETVAQPTVGGSATVNSYRLVVTANGNAVLKRGDSDVVWQALV